MESTRGENSNRVGSNGNIVTNKEKNTFEKPVEERKKSENIKIHRKESEVKDGIERQNKKRRSIVRIIGDILEAGWICFKLTVFISIVTIVVGFLLSRDMMIRGRNGNRLSVEGMVRSSAVTVNKATEDEKVEKWLKKAKRTKVTLEADDMRILVARQIVVDAESDKWVVVLHGYNGTMEDIYDIARHYAEQGYNIFMPDLRGHGESEGMFLGMGWLDRLDVINWIDVILEQNPSAKVVIHGVDIGADTALMLSGEPVKSSIKAIVAEGAYNNAWEVEKKEYKARHEKLPVFPFLHMINPVMKVWAGYALTDADAVKQVKASTIPILLIHGGNDIYASDDMTQELEQAIVAPHEVLMITTGTHEDCRYAEPDTYYQKTFDFVEKYVTP